MSSCPRHFPFSSYNITKGYNLTPLRLGLPAPEIYHKEGIHFVAQRTSGNTDLVRMVVASGMVPYETLSMGTSFASTRSL